MNAMEVYNAVDTAFKGRLNNMIMNRQMDAQQAQFVQNEWNTNAQQFVIKICSTTQYPGGMINQVQAQALADGFINTAMKNYAVQMQNRMGYMSPMNGMGNPMMNNGMMMNNPMMNAGNQFMSCMPGTSFTPMNTGNVGTMYGNPPSQMMQPQTSAFGTNGNPYCAGDNVDRSKQQNIQAFTQSMVQQATQPVVQTPVKEAAPVVTEPKVAWSIAKRASEFTKNPEFDETTGIMIQDISIYDANDVVEPVKVVRVETQNEFTSDLDAVLETREQIKNASDLNTSSEVDVITYPVIEMKNLGKTKLVNFKKFLKEKFDIEAFKRSSNSRQTVEHIVNQIREYIGTMTVNESEKIVKMIIDGINRRGMSGELAMSGDKAYQKIVKNLDEVMSSDNIDRVLCILVNTIKDICSYEILDLMDKNVREKSESVVPEYYKMKDLRDITDQNMLKDTIEEIEKDLCVVRHPRITYFMKGIKIPGVNRGDKINPVAAPMFEGTPDSTCEYLLADIFSKDHPVYNPIRMFFQSTPNLIMSYSLGYSLDKGIRVSPCLIG